MPPTWRRRGPTSWSPAPPSLRPRTPPRRSGPSGVLQKYRNRLDFSAPRQYPFSPPVSSSVSRTMLDSLTTRLTGIFDRLRGYGRLTEENVVEALREVRVALLEADVNFKVVKSFVDRIREKAIGQDVLKSLSPGQQVVKVVRDELMELLGGSGHRLAPAPHPPTVVMLIGLQGSGKTTSAAKLARHFQKQGQHPVLAAADIYRPAAIDQLKTLGANLGVPVLGEPGQKPRDICVLAREEAAQRGLSPLILDTAGRLHIDDEMLDELRVIKRDLNPHHVLLVVDAMTGQDAVTVAEKFNAAVG